MAHGITAENAARLNVEYWESQIERWAMRPYPLAEWGIRWLKAHSPVAPRVAIVHGDYRTGNFLEQGGRITAILDWELVHLGDPHEDLGWASLPMYMGGSKLICRLAEPEWFYARYAEKAGFEVVDGLGALLPGVLAAQARRHAHGRGALLRGRALQRHAHAGDGQPDRHLPAPDGQAHRGNIA